MRQLYGSACLCSPDPAKSIPAASPRRKQPPESRGPRPHWMPTSSVMGGAWTISSSYLWRKSRSLEV